MKRSGHHASLNVAWRGILLVLRRVAQRGEDGGHDLGLGLEQQQVAVELLAADSAGHFHDGRAHSARQPGRPHVQRCAPDLACHALCDALKCATAVLMFLSMRAKIICR